MTWPGKYARPERERRFLLAEEPPAQPGAVVLHLQDRYLDGTRLRLRLVRRDGVPPVAKLGQKVRPDAARTSTVAHTTLYLDRDEHDALAALPCAELRKRRTLLPWGDLVIAVDVFDGELAGLVLAEVDLGERGELPGALPLPVVAEVTDEEAFSGGALARSSADDLRALLGRWRA